MLNPFLKARRIEGAFSSLVVYETSLKVTYYCLVGMFLLLPWMKIIFYFNQLTIFA